MARVGADGWRLAAGGRRQERAATTNGLGRDRGNIPYIWVVGAFRYSVLLFIFSLSSLFSLALHIHLSNNTSFILRGRLTRNSKFHVIFVRRRRLPNSISTSFQLESLTAAGGQNSQIKSARSHAATSLVYPY